MEYVWYDKKQAYTEDALQGSHSYVDSDENVLGEISKEQLLSTETVGNICVAQLR
ncbi:hypothetical protein WA026_014243 [Henosepilachna vigintioctopunctata]|uniref:Uncharacterized protein n=1 Tax=Henosepilachna vigintioctopunctata TaxID=420089 RepID=A0AAW1TUK5_9CUCU